MSRQSPIRLYKRRSRELKHLPKSFFDADAFVDPTNPEVIVVIRMPDVDKDPLTFYHDLNHEVLHVVLHRIQVSDKVNRGLDSFVWGRQGRCIRLRDWELTMVELGL